LLFVGSSHGPEGKIAAEYGLVFRAVRSSPLTKSISCRNAASLARLGVGVFRARRVVKEFDPDVVVGTGGYTTAAVLIAAWSYGRRIVIQEQNAVPGRTNLWLARLATKICCGFEEAASAFPADKVVITGTPIRREFRQPPAKNAARRQLGLDESAFVIVAIGGSQGAKRLNELLLGAWPRLDDGTIQVLHQVGERNLKDFPPVESRNYLVRGYVDAPSALASADLVVARSGASTVAEITALGKPSVLLPYPHAYTDEQRRNASCLSKMGAAVVLEETGLSQEQFTQAILDLRGAPSKLASMGEAARAIGRPDAARHVAEVVCSVA